jgi:hypothetical protein
MFFIKFIFYIKNLKKRFDVWEMKTAINLARSLEGGEEKVQILFKDVVNG